MKEEPIQLLVLNTPKWLLLAVALFLLGCGSVHQQPAPPEREPTPKIFTDNPWLDNLSTSIDFISLKGDIRSNRRISDIEKVDSAVAAKRRVLDSVSTQISFAEGYLLRHPSAHYDRELAKYKTDLDKYEREYADTVKFLEPYRAEYVVETRRSAARKSKFKELVLNFVTLQGIPAVSVMDCPGFIFYVDSATLQNGKLAIHSHLVVPPDNPSIRSENLRVHASVNGQNLGRVETKPERLQVGYTAAGKSTEFIHKISVEDLSIPAAGTIEFIVDTGSGSNAPLKVNYSGSEQHLVKAGSTIVVQGRRDGDHIFIATKFRVADEEITRECLVDTGASMTTVPRSVFHVTTKGTQRFTTANGEITLPVVESSVTVGQIERDLKIALSSDDSVCLLGANFFAGYLYTIDLENHAIYLIKQ